MAAYWTRILSSARTAWVLAAILLVAVVLIASGVIDLRSGGLSVFGKTDYVDEKEHLAGADSSQALHMRLEGQYPGPLQDTTVERWRDPVDGTICYIYLPIAVAHEDGPSGLVQYGSANIGSISCYPERSSPSR